MTLGARPGLHRLYRDFGSKVEFVSVYVREAHPGERYSHHMSEEQKTRHASDWKQRDSVPWTVAIDRLDGATHQAYQSLPNHIYLLDSKGHVAFRALWAGQERLLRRKLEALLEHERNGTGPVNLGQRANMIVPMIHGGAEFDRALSRGGVKAKDDFRREMGIVIYGLQKLMSKLRPLIQ